MTEKIKGIGGWLILPIIGFIITLISYGYDLMTIFIFTDIRWIALITITDVAGIFLFGNTLSLIFHERKEAPRWAIASMWYGVFISILAGILIGELEFYGLFGVIIWTAYFTESKRVKNTFVK